MTLYLNFQRISLIECRMTNYIGFLGRTFTTSSCHLSQFPSVSDILCEKTQQECLERIKKLKLSPREPGNDNKKRAAVLIPLCITDNELSLLYTLRRANLKRHRGQVSFPGGVEDKDDKSLEETALRETEEELGIDRRTVKLWGPGSVVFGLEFTILPVVGFLGEVNLSELKPSPDEVESAFTISLKELCDSKHFRYTQFRSANGRGYVLPAYDSRQHRVWGMTALITHVFLTSLLPSHYKNKLEYIKPLKPS